MVPVTFLLPLVLLAQGPKSTPPVGPSPAAVVATVNGNAILASEVEGYLWDWYGTAATQEVVNYELVKQAADKEKVTVSDAEVESFVDDQMAKYKLQAGATGDVEAALRAQGVTRSRIVMRSRMQLLAEKLVSHDFKKEDYVKVATILFRTKSASAEDLSAALKSASKAYDRLAKGATWMNVLRDNSDSPQVADTEGVVGWRAISLFPEPAQTELKKLPVLGFTKPVQTQNGIQIFRIVTKGANGPAKEIEELRRGVVGRAAQELINRLRNQAQISISWPPTPK